jgi:pyruvate dehydrogenase E2 component (dihydrolipoamide acetyltransferase)
MAVDFIIPKLGDNVTEATIVDWLVEDGAEVNEGDDIIELETDKAVVPVPANASGTIKLGPYTAGDTVAIDAVVATIGGRASEFAPGAVEQSKPDHEASPEPAADAAPQSQPAPDHPDSAPKATPVAQKMAADMGVNLTEINGSGAHGKITKADVLQTSGAEPPAPAAPMPDPKPQPASAPAPAPKPQPVQPTAQPATPEENILERVPLKGIRGIIARRMLESVQNTARVTLVSEVDATELVALREQLKARYAEAWGFAPGYNELLAMIVANGLKEFPFMNARFAADGESIEYLKPINMGMAVDTPRGLLVTVIRDLDKKGLQEIGSEFRGLVKRARDSKSGPDDLTGSTFTISNLGMNRVDAFTPVINMPEAAILGVGRINEKPVVKDGEIVIRKMLTLSLVFDHRLTDGAPAARFLDFVCEIIEEPYLLFLTRK